MRRMSQNFMQRVYITLCVPFVLMLFYSCSGTPCREWIFLDSGACDPEYNSGRLLLRDEDTLNRLELEIDKTESGIRMYLNLSLLPAAPLPEDERKTAIELILEDGERMTLFPYRFVGGQRLLLPDEATSYLIGLLLDEQSFTMKIGRNELYVVPDNFRQGYDFLIDILIDPR